MGYNVRAALGMAVFLVMLNARVVEADPIMPVNRPPTVDHSGTAGEDKNNEELDQAREKFKQRQYDETLGLLKRARVKNTQLPPARLMLAGLFLSQNQLSSGRAVLEQAATEDPDYPGIYLVFSTLAVAENRLTDALLHLEKAATLAKSEKWTGAQKRSFHIQYHEGMANVAESRKNWPMAQATLAAVLELVPKNGQARQRLARALFEVNKCAEAAKELEKAVQDDPTLQPAAITMGWLYTQKGDLKRAAQWMEYAAKRDPKSAQVNLSMAGWLLDQGKAEEAKSYAEAANKLDPNSRGLKLLRGLIARHLKDYPQAEGYLQALYQEAPEDYQTSNQLALVLVEQPHPTKQARALELAAANVRQYPNAAEAQATLGWVYFRLGKLEGAERALQAAVAGGTASPETAYYLAHVMAARGRVEAAEKLLKGTLNAPGSFFFRKEAHDWLARISK